MPGNLGHGQGFGDVLLEQRDRLTQQRRKGLDTLPGRAPLRSRQCVATPAAASIPARAST
jgi:hypothetical protein